MIGLPPTDPPLDEHTMQLALQQALVVYETDEVPIGAIIAVGTRILAKSHNQVKLLNSPTVHAEMLAIAQATTAIGGKYFPQCMFYAIVEPCPVCMGTSRWTQIRRIVYDAADPKGDYMRYNNTLPHSKSVAVGGVCERECRELMVSYFQCKCRFR